MPFYENYVYLCNQINKSPSAVAIELKLGKPSVSRWKSGTKPRDSTLLRVANYFGVSVEDLTGDNIRNEAEEKEATNTGDLSDAELKLIELFRKLPAETQSSFPALLEATLKAQGLL